MKNRFLILYKYKLAFAMVPKTGISSIAKLILDLDDYKITKKRISYSKVWRYCSKPEIRKKIYSDICPDSYDAICFVRNPFSRVYSSFKHFTRKTGHRRKLKGCNEFNKFVKKEIFKMKNEHFFSYEIFY